MIRSFPHLRWKLFHWTSLNPLGRQRVASVDLWLPAIRIPAKGVVEVNGPLETDVRKMAMQRRQFLLANDPNFGLGKIHTKIHDETSSTNYIKIFKVFGSI